MLSRIRSLLNALFRRPAFERDMAEELRAHLETRIDDLVRSGASRADAERTAAIEFGGVETYKERCRQSRGLRLFDDLRNDALFFLRSLRRNALLSFVVVLTLTLGIGMDTGVFTMINAIVLRPRVDKDPETFVRVFLAYSQDVLRVGQPGSATLTDYAAYRDKTRTLSELAAWAAFPAMIEEDTVQTGGLMVTCNFFSLHGLERPKLGRLFTQEECASPGGMPVIVLSEELWRDRFAADPGVVGKVFKINHQLLTVVGVAPAGFSGRLTSAQAWVPYTLQPLVDIGSNLFEERETAWLHMAGRLNPGQRRSGVEAETSVLATQQDRLHPGRKTTATITDGSLIQEPGMSPIAAWAIPLMMGPLTLVLLIACANVATLLLSRAASRQREVAIRLALGAGRMRLIRMLLTESLMLSIVAGVSSLGLAYKVPLWLERFLFSDVAGHFQLTPDWRIFAYTSVVALLAGGVSGLAPALESLKVDLSSSMKGTGNVFGAVIKSRVSMRDLLVGAQVAMSLVLLAGASIFVRTHQRAKAFDSGFETRQTLIVWLVPRHRADAHPSGGSVSNAIQRRVETLPGVQSVAFSETPLVSGAGKMMVTLSGQGSRDVSANAVSPGFFETLSIPIVHGRAFSDADTGVAVVSETCARTFWPGENPIGKRMDTPDGGLAVVGVARDVSLRFGTASRSLVYPLWKRDSRLYPLLVRFSGDSQPVQRAVVAALAEVAPGISPIPQIIQASMDRQITAVSKFASLILILGAVALVLATTGIYGVVAFAAMRRTKEIGIRVALGARRSDIVREMLRSNAKPVVAGLLVGLPMTLAAAVVLARFMARTALPFDTRDPVTYGAVMLLLASTALIAILVPTRRAAGADPLKALRQE